MTALDLADRLQTPILVMSDLELGMNDNLADPFTWDDERCLDRGKVLGADDLEKIETFGRYLDVDGDGIGYRTLPGTHPEKGAFFTRGTSRDEYAAYTEAPEAYSANMDRLLKKWETARKLVPAPVVDDQGRAVGIVFYGPRRCPYRKPWTGSRRTASNWTPCASAVSRSRTTCADSSTATRSCSSPSRTVTRR